MLDVTTTDASGARIIAELIHAHENPSDCATSSPYRARWPAAGQSFWTC